VAEHSERLRRDGGTSLAWWQMAAGGGINSNGNDNNQLKSAPCEIAVDSLASAVTLGGRGSGPPAVRSPWRRHIQAS
jgi:hypothetical protein